METRADGPGRSQKGLGLGGASILVVDDSPPIVQLLTSLLTGQGYRCASAESAEEAQELLSRETFDLLLSDINMPPGQSGLELIKEVIQTYPDTAAIMVSGVDSTETGRLALEFGAYGYIVKPFNNNELLINVANALIRRRLNLENRRFKHAMQQEVLERTKELMATIQRMEGAENRLRASQEETIHRLALAAEFRDKETAQHIQRMSRYCELLARKLALADEQCNLIRAASPMHDIGKIGTTDNILLKKGKHTPEEFEIMKQHAEIGYSILSGSYSELLNMGAVIARTHHEKYDGSGYPRGLAGEDIPLVGRITTVADVFDALTSKRVYKPAFTVKDSLKIMQNERGSHFDPLLLDLFLEILPEVEEIRAQFAGG